MNWITKNIGEFLVDTLQNFCDFISDSINGLFELAVNACDTDELSGISGVTSAIAITLVAAMVLKQILTIYVLETDGDPDSDPLQLLVKGSEAIALIACNGAIFDLLLEMSTRFTSDVTHGVNVSSAIGIVRNIAFEGITGTGLIILPLFLIMLIIFMIILGIKAGLRGIELSLMKIAFPIFCVDLIGTNKERWNNFLASYVVTFFGYALQMLCFKVFILSLKGGETLTSYAVALGWIFMAIKTPEWLQKFVYTTGIARNISGAARMAPFMLMQIKK